jgi:IclR family transcriptional regulator, pca regulon regulatory protein
MPDEARTVRTAGTMEHPVQESKPRAARAAWFVASVEKAFQVLGAFESRKRSLSLTEIAEVTGLDKSAAQRFTYTLAALGYLKKDQDARRYTISPKILSLAMIYLRTDPLVARARHQLHELNEAIDATVNLTELDDTDIIYVVRYTGRGIVTADMVLGMRRPAFCSAGGRAILSTMPDDEVINILRRSHRVAYTAYTKTSVRAVMAEIHLARSRGFCLTAQEMSLGDISVAAPVRRADGTMTAAVNVSVSTANWRPHEAARKFGPIIRDVAHAVSEASEL